MSAKSTSTQTPPITMTVKTLFWRIVLSVIILAILAGPGANLLQNAL